MFLIKNNKNDVYPCKPQFYYIIVGLKGVKIIYVCFRDGSGARARDRSFAGAVRGASPGGHDMDHSASGS